MKHDWYNYAWNF